MQQNMMGPNIIITEPSSNLRALGRNALTGKWKEAIIAVMVYMLCIDVPPVILNALFGINMGDMYYNYGYDGMYYQYSYVYDSMPTYSFLSGIYLILVSGAFTLGVTLFFLAMFRRQIVGVSDIFLGFERFGKALGLMLFQSLFIFLWSLLLIVPGVIASIRYSQAFFILADDPNKTIRECMNESKRMMVGNKWKFFCLSFSFIGWYILAVIPASVLASIAEILYAPAVVTAIISIVGTLFMVPVMAYSYATFAGFYEILAGHLIKETEPAPIDPEPIPQPAPPAPAEEPEPKEENVNQNVSENADDVKAADTTHMGSINNTANAAKSFDVAMVFAEAEKDENAGSAVNTADAADAAEADNKEDNDFLPKEIND